MRRIFIDLWSKYKSEIGVAFGIALLYLFFFAVGITCPIKFVTGISCPGCGMSRALFHAVTGKFQDAFHYHPMWITLPVVGILLPVFKLKRKNKHFSVTLAVFCVLMIAVYVYRMFFLCQDIVVFSPAEGVLPRAYRFLKRLCGIE